MRKVVSWCTHPAVDYYRWLATGAQAIVTAWGRSYEVTSLKTAAADLRRAVDRPEHPQPSCCERCRARMSAPSILVAGAAQMYEEVPPFVSATTSRPSSIGHRDKVTSDLRRATSQEGRASSFGRAGSTPLAPSSSPGRRSPPGSSSR